MIDYELKYRELVDILKRNITLNNHYWTNENGSTKAFQMTVEDCTVVQEDEDYTDDCYPNSDFEIIEKILNEDL